MDPIQKAALSEAYYQNLYAGLVNVHFSPLIPNATVNFYLDEQQQWRWQICSPNGEVTGISKEGYSDKGMCKQNLVKVTHEILTMVEKETD